MARSYLALRLHNLRVILAHLRVLLLALITPIAFGRIGAASAGLTLTTAAWRGARVVQSGPAFTLVHPLRATVGSARAPQARCTFSRPGFTLLASAPGVRSIARPPASTRFAQHMTLAAMSALNDFDFMIGEWTVSHQRLKQRLVGCGEWTEFTGTSSTRKILRGYGNVEDNVLHFPEGSIHAAAIRSFDPNSGNWAIWWLDGRSPHQLDVPVIGKFTNGVGAFYAKDMLDGKPIVVRFLWHPNPGSRPRWEQAFSPDGGQSWEVNWIMHFARVTA